MILTQKHTQNYSSLLPNFFIHIVLPHFFAFFCCFRHQIRSPRYDTISVAPALSHSDASLSYYCQSHRDRALIDTIFASPGSLYRGVDVVAGGEGSRCCCFSMATATLCTFSPSMPLGHSRRCRCLQPSRRRRLFTHPVPPCPEGLASVINRQTFCPSPREIDDTTFFVARAFLPQPSPNHHQTVLPCLLTKNTPKRTSRFHGLRKTP